MSPGAKKSFVRGVSVSQPMAQYRYLLAGTCTGKSPIRAQLAAGRAGGRTALNLDLDRNHGRNGEASVMAA